MRHKTVFIFRDGAYKFSQKCFFFTLRKRKLQLGELITHPFAYRKAVDISIDANDITNTGFYAVYCWEEDIASKHYPIQLGHLIVFQDGQGGSISQFAISSEGYAYTRMKWGDRSWSDWR